VNDDETTGPQDSRQAALERAARAIFERRGYAAATIRSISSAAGVAPSVLSSYYRNKADLFAAVMNLPFDPAAAIPRLVAPGLDGMGERLVRLALRAAEDDQLRADVSSAAGVAPGVLSSGIANAPVSTEQVRAVWEFVSTEIIDQALARVGVGDARMRGALVSAYLGGVLVTRYGARVEPLASAPEDQVVALVAPTIQGLIDPTNPLPRA
jgi:AcrR family transcriptional regulator